MNVGKLQEIMKTLPQTAEVYVTSRTGIETYCVFAIDITNPEDESESVCINIRLDTEDDE
jgi:hypothetical protein